ncbi:hypothetical protein L6164_037534 [Bauhinia variegata]|uniref:Uncharacterized protein n=1 Tax=Bauhinia variegata TaxID=167791 RepID=A0ACB9KKG5_BAUVA|nr:hypothetical protein L6164_037534 [Bauhinia variegata]
MDYESKQLFFSHVSCFLDVFDDTCHDFVQVEVERIDIGESENTTVNDGLKDMQDSIFNIRNAVRFVRSSPSRLAKFKDCVNFASLLLRALCVLMLLQGGNSTYLMLKVALRFQAAFEKLENDDRSYVEHFGELGPPSASDWLNANVFLKFLKIFYDAAMILSGTLHITTNSAFHQLALILIEFNTWYDMYIRIKNMLSKLYSWYSMAYEQGNESTQESSPEGSQSEHGGTVKSDGLYNGPPSDPQSKLIHTYIEEKHQNEITCGDKSRVGRGGMTAKVKVVVNAAKAGIPVIITSGFAPENIIKVLQGQHIGTIFHQDAQLWAPVKEVDAREMAVAGRDCSRQLQGNRLEVRVSIMFLRLL